MAYGNWGAFVYRNGERMQQWEDQTPYAEESEKSGYAQAFQRREGLNLHHAVLGGAEVRLCGYKHWPSLWYRMEPVDLAPYRTGVEWGEDYSWSGEVHGYKFSAEQYDGNMIDLELVDPDGTRWTATCGFEYGAGWMD